MSNEIHVAFKCMQVWNNWRHSHYHGTQTIISNLNNSLDILCLLDVFSFFKIFNCLSVVGYEEVHVPELKPKTFETDEVSLSFVDTSCLIVVFGCTLCWYFHKASEIWFF